MKIIIFLFFTFFSFSTIQSSEVSEWFEKESNQFLEIINNNQGTESENYEKYKYFVNKNKCAPPDFDLNVTKGKSNPFIFLIKTK